MKEFKCGHCAELVSRNVYYCSKCEWHICWRCVKKSTFTNELKCPNPSCNKIVVRVDR
jgi:hypothetical protein